LNRFQSAYLLHYFNRLKSITSKASIRSHCSPRIQDVPYHEAKSVQNVGRRHFKVNVIATSVEGSESIKC
jgi:hypothetical protein